jgi:hypothetical protein
MGYLLRRNEWMWGKPCSCCRQFEIDQAKKQDRRAKRAARKPVVPEPYPTLHSLITRTMNWYYGYGSAYGRSTQN